MIFLIAFFSTIKIAKIEGVINPPTASYMLRAIKTAEKEGSECLIFELDTPGGLDKSMRKVTKSILNATLPIIVYVSPQGARCASAGVFILLSSHIAVMAPGTNIGAAHPVALGKEMPKEMKKKVENDAVAYIRSIAKKRGKNEEWAEEAVRKSVSITAEEAEEKGVIDFVAQDVKEVIEKIDGWEVNIGEEVRTLNTKDKKIEKITWTMKEKFLSKITNPTIAYILLTLGLWGIILEFSHPGAIFPGVFGGISLLLAFYALHLLPVNYAGVGLIILGFILFILEALTPTYGPLSIGGVISLVLGSFMLIEGGVPFLQVSRLSIFIVTGITASFFVFILTMIFRTMRKKPLIGMRGFIGKKGVVKEKITPEKKGRVFINGEWWNAVADEIIEVDEEVEVIKINHLTIKVKKIK
jgi:membrane-bound serine protease (ClpP class)